MTFNQMRRFINGCTAWLYIMFDYSDINRCPRCRSRHHTNCWDPAFRPWDGKARAKQLYDVQLTRPDATGASIIYSCWPAGACMHTTNGTGIIYHPAEIRGVRISEYQQPVVE